MEKVMETLQQYFRQNPPFYGNAEFVLDILSAHSVGTMKGQELFVVFRLVCGCCRN